MTRILSLLLLIFFCAGLSAPASVSAGGSLWLLDASMGYIFVSEARGPRWLEDTQLPRVALGAGGESWVLGVSVDYSCNSNDYAASIPGVTDGLESVERNVSNTSLKAFIRIVPGGRRRTVAPYLSLGAGPAITTVEYVVESTGRSHSDSAVRLGYAVSIGTRLHILGSPFSAFLEGSYGALGEVSQFSPEESGFVPGEELTYVCVTAGLGVTF